MEGSKPGKLNAADATRILKGAAVVAAGALLTYFTSVIANIDFGPYTPIVTAAWSIVVNFGRIWVADNS